jgi:hypothetical protein
MLKKIQAAQIRQLIFSLLVLVAFVSCEESGTVGAGFVDESEIVIDTILVSNLPFNTTDPFLGKLTYSPVGSFSDPLYGDIEAMGLFKPSIIRGEIGDITTETQAILRLNVDIENVYGNQTTDGTFKVYRVADLWRGSAIRMSDDIGIINIDGGPITSAEIGEFAFADVDTTGFVELPLGGTWKSDFVGFYNNADQNRDSLYRYEDFGLAIVPEDDVDKVIHTRFSTSRLLLINADQDTSTNILLDWAYDIDITGGTTPNGNITLSNTFNPFLDIDFTPIAQQLSNNNFIRAELVLTPDSTTISSSLTETQKRTENPPFRVQLGPSDDIAYDLGFNTINTRGVIEEGLYKFDITGLFNAFIFGETDISEIYLYAGQNQGYLGFNTFFGFNADASAVPKVLIYNLEESN